MPTDMMTMTQAVAFAVMCAQETEIAAPWRGWAGGWLAGDDRARPGAQAAANAATAPAARLAAAAAGLLADAEQLRSDATLLAAEGRNARWHLDEAERRNQDCLAAVAEAIRASGQDQDGDRAREFKARAEQDY